jgi:hypothetical protein
LIHAAFPGPARRYPTMRCGFMEEVVARTRETVLSRVISPG